VFKAKRRCVKTAMILSVVLFWILWVGSSEGYATEQEKIALGDNVYGEIENQTLLIKGTGSMWNYVSEESPLAAFQNEFTEVFVKEGVTTIGRSVFKDLTNINRIILPKTLTHIYGFAFYNTSIESVEIPQNVYVVQNTAFANCSELEQIQVNPINTHYVTHEGVLYTKNYQTLITYPKGKESTYYRLHEQTNRIDGFAFYHLENLEVITIPRLVFTVGKHAFYESKSIHSIINLHDREYQNSEVDFFYLSEEDGIKRTAYGYKVNGRFFGNLSEETWNKSMEVEVEIATHTDELTNEDVLITIHTNEEYAEARHKLSDDEEWTIYENPFVISANTTVLAQVVTEQGLQSQTERTITNIVKQNPTIAFEKIPYNLMDSTIEVGVDISTHPDTELAVCQYQWTTTSTPLEERWIDFSPHKKLDFLIEEEPLFLHILAIDTAGNRLEEWKDVLSWHDLYWVHFIDENGQLIQKELLNKDDKLKKPDSIDRLGYTFEGWVSLDDGQLWDFDVDRMPSDLLQLEMKWTVNETTPYKIMHYLQSLSEESYELFETENLIGKTGSLVLATKKAYEGFQPSEYLGTPVEGVIQGDGSLILECYYDRKSFTVTYMDGENSIYSQKTVSYGSNLSLPPPPEMEGKVFIRWDENLPEHMPSSNLTFNAIWEPEENKLITPYEIKHFIETLEGEWELDSVETKYGKAGDRITANPKEIEGFVPLEEGSEIISEDGTTKIRQYYERKIFCVIYLTSTGEIYREERARYGEKLDVPTGPYLKGYSFVSWDQSLTQVNSNLTLRPIYQKRISDQVKQESRWKMSMVGPGNHELSKVTEANHADGDSIILEMTPQQYGMLLSENTEIQLETNDQIITIPMHALSDPSEVIGTDATDMYKRIELHIRMTKLSSDETRELHSKCAESDYALQFMSDSMTLEMVMQTMRGEIHKKEITYALRFVKSENKLGFIEENQGYLSFSYNRTTQELTPLPTLAIKNGEEWLVTVSQLEINPYIIVKIEKCHAKADEQHWAKEVEREMICRGIIRDSTTNNLDDAITRGDFVTDLMRGVGLNGLNTKQENAFNDLFTPHSEAVTTASILQLVNGYPDGSFRPDTRITRQEAMVIYERMIKRLGLETSNLNEKTKWIDEHEIEYWAKDAADLMTRTKIFGGTPKGLLMPKEWLTKGEAIQSLSNLLKQSNLID